MFLFQDCLATLGFSQEEILFIWKMIAAILKIGNIEFVPKIQSVQGRPLNFVSKKFLSI